MSLAKFKQEPDDFYKELKTQIKEYFVSNNLAMHGSKKLSIKISFMFLLYCVVYASIYFISDNNFLLFCAYGFLGGWSVLLGLNIGHDAAHGAIFKNRSHNKKLLYIFEILGTNSYNWVNRHLGAHHRYPNVMDYDSDIQQTNIVKIFPQDKHKKIHQMQHLYMPFLYMFYILRWVIYRDFKDAKSKNIGVFDNSNYPKKEVYRMIFFKLFYLLYLIVIPAIALDLSITKAILAFLFLTLCGSLVITLVLLSTHVGEDANFPEPNENNTLPHSWSYHQVITAADFATESYSINFLFGGFNHHVIHHLFPHISHIHYPALTPILRKCAEKYGLPYRSKKYLASAVLSHFKLLKRNGENVLAHSFEL